GSADLTWSSKTVAQSHTYASAGTYTATLTATNNCGVSAPVSRTIAVGTPPGPTAPTAVLTASPTSGTAPLTVQFSAANSSDGTPPTSYTLTFGDGAPPVTWSARTVAQSHPYGSAGTFMASLTASNSAGTSAASTQTISVATAGTACIPSPLPPSGQAIATFHSMGLYYNPPSAPGNGTLA